MTMSRSGRTESIETFPHSDGTPARLAAAGCQASPVTAAVVAVRSAGVDPVAALVVVRRNGNVDVVDVEGGVWLSAGGTLFPHALARRPATAIATPAPSIRLRLLPIPIPPSISSTPAAGTSQLD